jgi:hypothetical protein
MKTICFEAGRRIAGADERTFVVDTFTDSFSVEFPDDGVVCSSIREAGTVVPAYALAVCCAQWNEEWYERWLAAFAASPGYRERFRMRTGENGNDWTLRLPDVPAVGR